MKYRVTTIFLFLALFTHAQNGYEIKVTLKPFKNQYIYLGHYYGKQLPIIDSVKLNNNSEGIFKGPKPLTGGIYLIGFPDRANKVEMLVGRQQKFSVLVDTLHPDKIIFTGSAENSSFKAYQEFMVTQGRYIDAQRRKMAGASLADSIVIAKIIDSVSQQINTYRIGVINKEPKGLLTALLKGMREPEVPVNEVAAKKDSLYAYHYFKTHYWDGVEFWDERLTRTPFFEGRVDKYFDQLVYPVADSVIKEMDWMLSYASASDEMQKFLLLKFINRYLNQKFMWEDAVFVHMFEKYFAQKNYPWLTSQGRKTITDRAYSLMANIMGKQAADISLPDEKGKNTTLFNVNAAYTLLVIYDPTCGHCKETLPKLDSFYRAKWKAMGVKMFGLAKETDGKESDWHAIMKKTGMQDWVNVYYSKEAEKARVNANIPSYSQLYDVQTFPTLYLLDKDKRIIAKKVTDQQVDEILEQRGKQKGR